MNTATKDLLDRVSEEMQRHAPPLSLCMDCGRTFTDELAHACQGFWNGSLGGFIPDERDPKRVAKGYAV